MVAETIPHAFDPLLELYGQWTTGLAWAYLPIPGAAPGTSFECVDGYLIMDRYRGNANGYAMLELATLIKEPARAAGHRVYPTVNVSFSPQTWIQSDLTIVREPIKNLVWVPVENVLVVGEFVSLPSKCRDRIDKPRMCAEAGIPFYLRVKISEFDAHVELLRLDDGRYVPQAKALGGMTFETETPFPMKFDPATLLES